MKEGKNDGHGISTCNFNAIPRYARIIFAVKNAAGFRSLGEIVGDAKGVLERLTLTSSDLGRLERVWPAVLGEALATHCRPAFVDGARMTVHADAAVWGSRLRHLQSTMLARLADAGFGQIKEMRIVVRPREGKG